MEKSTFKAHVDFRGSVPLKSLIVVDLQNSCAPEAYTCNLQNSSAPEAYTFKKRLIYISAAPPAPPAPSDGKYEIMIIIIYFSMIYIVYTIRIVLAF